MLIISINIVLWLPVVARDIARLLLKNNVAFLWWKKLSVISIHTKITKIKICPLYNTSTDIDKSIIIFT